MHRIQLIITIRNHYADTYDSLNSTDKANRFAHTEQANINLKPIIYETDYVADLHNIFSNAVYYKHLPPPDKRNRRVSRDNGRKPRPVT